ncbi:MAG TPA: cryptochrome/photolyase family protein [Holophagaceae bacterium]|nr:cryptochrome/photolyase family protein [Holophagaceae bacterium]
MANRGTVVLPWDLDPRLAAFPARPADGWLLVVESRAKPGALPWHRQKLLMVLAALRHFVQARRAEGYHVVHVVAEDYASALRDVHRWAEPGRLRAHRPREWALDRRFQALADEGLLELLDDGGPGGHFIASRAEFEAFAEGRGPLLQEAWYRRMRRHTGLLMRGSQPEGGRWNFDAENRSHARHLEVPPPAWFQPDALTRGLMPWAARVGRFGRVEPFGWPVTREQALQWLEAFAEGALAAFGPTEDALRQDARVLFHSRLSAPLNLGLLDPMECCAVAERAYAQGKVPLASAEGFIRQILGWREFIRGAYWHLMPGLREANGLGHHRPLPAAFWDPGATDMACVGEAVRSVHDLGWTHHIPRLMVLCNFANLVEADPRAVSHWFWATFVDAFEWVELPNVLGMGLFATEAFTTKPYVASAAYLKRQMGLPAKGLGRGPRGRTACEGCRYDPDRRTGEGACPFNFLYWRFLHRHRALFEANPRSRALLGHLDRMDPEARAALLAEAEAHLAGLAPADPGWEAAVREDAG